VITYNDKNELAYKMLSNNNWWTQSTHSTPRSEARGMLRVDTALR